MQKKRRYCSCACALQRYNHTWPFRHIFSDLYVSSSPFPSFYDFFYLPDTRVFNVSFSFSPSHPVFPFFLPFYLSLFLLVCLFRFFFLFGLFYIYTHVRSTLQLQEMDMPLTIKKKRKKLLQTKRIGF